ncbi:MAG: hypothetical protein IKN54_05425 [Lachnospiraceae bacterium]|nr:hypothetical protein [Lachnospiraceae bacterium]
MKKLIVLLMIICLATCGCSKQDEPTTADTPSTTVTETPTKSESNSETNTDKMACALCGEITDCTGFTRKIWNNDIGDYVKKVYYLCDDCYLTASRNETDCINYDNMIANLQLAVTSKEVYKIISSLEGEGILKMGPAGITFDNMEQCIIDELYALFPTLDQVETQKNYQIILSYGKNVYIKRDIAPVSILDTID